MRKASLRGRSNQKRQRGARRLFMQTVTYEEDQLVKKTSWHDARDLDLPA